MIKKIFIFFSALIFFSAYAHAQLPEQPETKASLVSEYSPVAAGKPFRLAVVLEHKEAWHSYWQNPGEAGIPTTLTWTLPEGYKASAIDWPAPELLREGPLVVYAYHGKVFLPVTITPPASQTEKQITIKVKAEWLACKDICIPESTELETPLTFDNAANPSEYAELFSQFDNTKPTQIAEKGEYSYANKKLVIAFPRFAFGVKDIRNAVFFPINENLIIYSAEQQFTVDNDTVTITLSQSDENPSGDINGVLRIESAAGERYFNVTFSAATAPPIISSEQSSRVTTPDIGFFLVLFFAISGGIILNLMPCVLPVLSLKALVIAKKAGQEHTQVAKLGVAYTLGILLSFALIAGVLISLQSAGQAVGWGYQMQSPAFVAFLAYLLFLVGLNLSGIFDLPTLLGDVGSELANESSLRGSFFTGVLATAVATPCTAPFMASAVGVALTMPAWKAMIVFLALGFGLALPFLLISVFPRLLRFLPKPGAWMNTFKQFLAFPMYASVIWLLWVLTLQAGAGGLAIALISMLGFVVIIWMKGFYTAGSSRYRLITVLLSVAVLLISLPMLSNMNAGDGMMPNPSHNMKVVHCSKDALNDLRKNNIPVFVDATAAWCITCQVNARVAIHTERTINAFNENNVTLMIADWTKRNSEISEFLKSFGYQGVPLYVYYPPNGEPVILPQLLTQDIVIKTITKQE